MIKLRFVAWTLVFISQPSLAGLTTGTKSRPAPDVEKLTSEIGGSHFSSLYRGLKAEMDAKEFDRAMAAFQELRAKHGGEPTTEEVFRATEQGSEKQAFDLFGLFRRVVKACTPSFVDVNREAVRMNAEEAAWKRQFNRSHGCMTSLDNILKSRTSEQQTAGVVGSPTTGGASASN